MSEHKVIYLQPKRCVEENYGRLWSDADNPSDEEDENGEPIKWIKYVLAEDVLMVRSKNTEGPK